MPSTYLPYQSPSTSRTVTVEKCVAVLMVCNRAFASINMKFRDLASPNTGSFSLDGEALKRIEPD